MKNTNNGARGQWRYLLISATEKESSGELSCIDASVEMGAFGVMGVMGAYASVVGASSGVASFGDIGNATLRLPDSICGEGVTFSSGLATAAFLSDRGWEGSCSVRASCMLTPR